MTLIAVPLEAELRIIRAVLTAAGIEVALADRSTLPGGAERTGGGLSTGGRTPMLELVPDLDAALFRGGHGKAEFAARCAWVLAHHPEIDRIIVAGTAGAISQELQPGDVVIATEVVEHDYRERFDPRARLPRFTADEVLAQALEDAASSPPPVGANTIRGSALHRGAIAGGDEDIVDHLRARELADSTGAIAVAWESPGGARAARVAGVSWCELRGVSDGADAAAATDFRAFLEQAMQPVGRILAAYLRQNTPVDRGQPLQQ